MLPLSLTQHAKTAIFLFLLALAARMFFFAALLVHYGPGSFYLANNGAPLTTNDTMNYVVIAKSLVERGVYSRFVEPPFDPDSFRTPLLPLYFVPFVYFFGLNGITPAMLLLIIILSVTPVAAYRLARLFLSHRLSILAGVIIAFEPLLAYRSNIAEPDALIVLLFTLAVYWFVLFCKTLRHGYAYAAFASLALLTLAKPVGAYVIVLFSFFIIVFMVARKLPLARAARIMGLSGLIVLLLLGPWLVRNYRVFGVWGLSSVKAYNLYYYYTAQLAPPDEPPPRFKIRDQDPLRNIANAGEITSIAIRRIIKKPWEYAKLHLIGTVRNALASDFPAFRHHQHLNVLPFAYNPVHQSNLTDMAARGEAAALARAVTAREIPYLARLAALVLFYLTVVFGWMRAWARERQTFWLFTAFLISAAFFVLTPGTFVDAKYRLPAVPLLVIMFLYVFEKR